MYFSTYHWKQVVNGYSGYSPFSYRRTITEMQGFPSQRSVNLLRGLGITYVLWDWNWVQSERMEEYNVRLFSTPGLSHAGDFGSKSVFRVEPEPVSQPQEMEVAAVAPSVTAPGTAFGLGLLARNSSGAPMVCVEEEPQPFTLTFRDGSGSEVLTLAGEYRPPFFADAGRPSPSPCGWMKRRPRATTVPSSTSRRGSGTRDFELG